MRLLRNRPAVVGCLRGSAVFPAGKTSGCAPAGAEIADCLITPPPQRLPCVRGAGSRSETEGLYVIVVRCCQVQSLRPFGPPPFTQGRLLGTPSSQHHFRATGGRPMVAPTVAKTTIILRRRGVHCTSAPVGGCGFVCSRRCQKAPLCKGRDALRKYAGGIFLAKA